MSIFSKVKNRRPKRSNFDLSHEVKLSTEFGRLTPILCQEVLPGDVWKSQSEIFCRMAPMLAPIMHRVDVYTHFFFVPNRILWDHWEEFITGTPKNGDLKNPVFYLPPSIQVRSDSPLLLSGQLPDYLGIPIFDSRIFDQNNTYITFSALPFQAYQSIYNEYYRDENFKPEIDIKSNIDGMMVGSGSTLDLLTLRYRAWEKDYFTSALPWPQKGPDVALEPFDDFELNTNTQLTGPTRVYDSNGNPFYPSPSNGSQLGITSNGTVGTVNDSGSVSSGGLKLISDPIRAEVSGVRSTTINELRHAERLQEFLEKDARGGTRLTEILRSHFGVVASDARLQRPEYIGGGKTNVIISEVLQQSQTTPGQSNLGEMAGHGVSAGVSHKFKFKAYEHGFIIGILSIIPRSAYQQGLHRMFTRPTRYDYAWPEFAHLGEQTIKNQEIFFNYGPGASANLNEQDFGYAPRYAEYKFINSSVHGDFHDKLDFWHIGRMFGNTPTVSQIIDCKPDDTNKNTGVNRIFAVTDKNYDHFWIQVYNKITAKRPLPYYGTPTL